MSQEMWCCPRVSCASVSAEKIGRSGQPVQKPAGRGRHHGRQAFDVLVEGEGLFGGAGGLGPRHLGEFRLAGLRLRVRRGGGVRLQRFGPVALQEFAQAVARMTWVVYSPAIGSTSLPDRCVATPARRSTACRFCSM